MQNQNSPGVWIVILIIILIGGGYFTWQYLGGQDKTVDWQTCENLQYGFTIKYPQDYLIDELSCNYNPPYEDSLINATVTDALKKDYVIVITSFQTTLTLQEWIKNTNDYPSTLWSTQKPGNMPNSVQFDSVATHFASIDTIVKREGTLLVISLGARNADVPVNKNVKQIYYQIISTLEFIKDSIVLYKTSSVYNGDIGGLEGADLKCDTDIVKPTGYKGYFLRAGGVFYSKERTDYCTPTIRSSETITPSILLPESWHGSPGTSMQPCNGWKYVPTDSLWKERRGTVTPDKEMTFSKTKDGTGVCGPVLIFGDFKNCADSLLPLACVGVK